MVDVPTTGATGIGVFAVVVAIDSPRPVEAAVFDTGAVDNADGTG
jgi:hypothetical protein